jgi:hypothetical protein
MVQKKNLNAVENLLPHPVLKIENAPSSLVAAINVQPEKNGMWLIYFTMFLNAGDNQRK